MPRRIVYRRWFEKLSVRHFTTDHIGAFLEGWMSTHGDRTEAIKEVELRDNRKHIQPIGPRASRVCDT
jgi:hypothetical protein